MDEWFQKKIDSFEVGWKRNFLLDAFEMWIMDYHWKVRTGKIFIKEECRFIVKFMKNLENLERN